MLKSHQAIVEMLTKENVKALAESIKAVEASKKTIPDMPAKVEKLYDEVQEFMTEFRSSSE